MKAGWQTKKLGDVCDFEGGSQPPKSQFIYEEKLGYVRFLQIRDFGSDKNITYIPESKKNRLCKENDILIGRYGASVGRILTNKAGAYNVALMKAIPNLGLFEWPWFYNYLVSDEFQSRLLNIADRSAQAGFSKDDIYNFPVPVPPRAEQQRIVGILDAAFDGIATAKANAEQNLKNAHALFESHLQSVFTQRGEGWVEKVLSDLYQIGSSKRVLKSQWKSAGVPFYRGREVTRLSADGIVDNELFICEEHYAELASKYGVPKAGDIVITAIGTIGNSYIVREEDKFYFKDASVLWLKRISDVSSEFVNFWLKSPLFFDQIDRGNGATVDTLTIQKLQSVLLYLPSPSEQKTIVAKLNALREETQHLESLYQRKLAALDELKKSLLHQAFSGVL